MQLELGKKYVRRDGMFTGELIKNTNEVEFNEGLCFYDPCFGNTYRVDGRYTTAYEMSADLVAIVYEYDVDTVTISRAEYDRFKEMEAAAAKLVKAIQAYKSGI